VANARKTKLMPDEWGPHVSETRGK
jgi:hypothetical protein